MQDDAKAALSDEVGAATHVEADMTDEMRYVLQAALDAYKEKEGTAATDAQRAFLTSTTLKHYGPAQGYTLAERTPAP